MAITRSNTPVLETPQAVARKREIANMLLGQTRGAKNIGEGFNAMMSGLVSRWHNDEADEAEQAGMASAADARNRIIAMMGGGTMPANGNGGAIGAANAVGGAGAPSDFMSSLITNESGGDWNALNEFGYGGRLQFGDARLADAARAGIIPEGMTGAQFSQLSPEQQQAVENWHFADIDQRAGEMGLNNYVGQNIGGVNITPDAIRAMAHLGGIGGAQQFIESGGQYNPSDAHGTSLLDYAQRHGGFGGAGALQPGQQSLQVASLAPSMDVPADSVTNPATGFFDPELAMAAPPVQSQQLAQAGQGSPQQVGSIPIAGPEIEMEMMLQALDNPWIGEGTKEAVRQYLSRSFPQLTANQSDFLFAQQNPEFTGFLGRGGEMGPDFINVETPQGIRTFNLSDPAQVQQVETLFSTGQGRQVGLGAGDSAAVERIQRLTENLMETGDFPDPIQAEQIAVGIVDGRFSADRDPITRELQIVDMATGRTIYGGSQGVPAGQPAASQPGALSGTFSAVDQATDPNLNAIMNGNTPASPFGPQYPAADQAFGLSGAAHGAANTVMDAIGLGVPYSDVQQTQADFDVLRESLLNDMASAYNRQPPSWLLQEIRDLTPAAGSLFEGGGSAQSKLNAIGRHLANELQLTEAALQRQLSPQNRQEMEARAQGLQAGISRVLGAINSFGHQQHQPSQGEVGADGWTTLPNGVRIREVQ